MGKLSKLASALDMSKKARMQRAQEMGFYDNTVYHGTAAKPTTVMSDGNIFDEFKLWEGEDPTRSTVRSPVSKLGVSLAEQPKIADSFASLASQNGSEGSAVLPLRFRADQVGHIDLDGRELNEEIFGTVADSWKSGFDAIQFRNYNIDGKNGSFVLVKDPSQIRSVNAAFDPAKKDSSNLMAGVTGAAVGAGALMQGEDAEASFLGRGAKMANKAALEIARKMKDNGATQDEIFEKTGWFQGADDAWRFEVDDSQISVNALQGGRLGDQLNHPELMDNYPDMRDMPATIESRHYGHGRASYDPASDSISAAGDSEYIPSGLMHETQHAIQAREGFARGGSHNEFGPAIEDGPSPYQQYRNLAGEVEARNVQGRLHMSPKSESYSRRGPQRTSLDLNRSLSLV